MEPNTTDSTLEVYVQANGADYTNQIFNALIFTVKWSSAAGYDIGSFTSEGFWSFIAPVTKQGAEVTDSGLEYQTFGFAGSTQTFNSGFGLTFNDGVKTLIGTIDIKGANTAGLDICSFKYSNDSYTDANNRNYYIEIAGAELSGSTAARNSIVSTYSSSTWDFCEFSNLESQDTAIISNGTYSLNADATVDYVEVAAGAGLEVVGSNSLSVSEYIKLEANTTDYAQYIGPAVAIDMDRYVGSTGAWRHIGIPVTGNLGDVLTLGGANMNFGTEPSNIQNLFTFSSTTFDWEAVASSATDIGLSGLTVYTGGSSFPVTDDLINVTGTSKDGAQAITYGYASNLTGNANNDGWNFIANPYPCNVDWNSIDDQDGGVFSSYSVWDPENEYYQSWNGTVGTNGGQQYIAAGQGFWVKASTSEDGTSFDFSEVDRTFSGDNTFVGAHKSSTVPNLVRLNVSSTKGNSDETVVYFPSNTSPFFNTTEGDALKPWNGGNDASNLFTYGLGAMERLAISAHGDFNMSTVIPVGFAGSTDSGDIHTIHLVEDLQSSNSWSAVLLDDLYLNQTYNLTSSDYVFTQDTLAPEHRFNLRFVGNGVGDNENAQSESSIYAFSNPDASAFEVVFKEVDQPSVDIQLYSISGHLVFESERVSTQSPFRLNHGNLAEGVYILVVENRGNTLHVQKLAKNNF